MPKRPKTNESANKCMDTILNAILSQGMEEVGSENHQQACVKSTLSSTSGQSVCGFD